jgi:hypothetical protein
MVEANRNSSARRRRIIQALAALPIVAAIPGLSCAETARPASGARALSHRFLFADIGPFRGEQVIEFLPGLNIVLSPSGSARRALAHVLRAGFGRRVAGITPLERGFYERGFWGGAVDTAGPVILQDPVPPYGDYGVGFIARLFELLDWLHREDRQVVWIDRPLLLLAKLFAGLPGFCLKPNTTDGCSVAPAEDVGGIRHPRYRATRPVTAQEILAAFDGRGFSSPVWAQMARNLESMSSDRLRV